MGDVWRADEYRAQTEVALKVIYSTTTMAPSNIDEVRLARRHTHPGVGRVFESVTPIRELLLDGDLHGADLANGRRVGRLPSGRWSMWAANCVEGWRRPMRRVCAPISNTNI